MVHHMKEAVKILGSCYPAYHASTATTSQRVNRGSGSESWSKPSQQHNQGHTNFAGVDPCHVPAAPHARSASLLLFSRARMNPVTAAPPPRSVIEAADESGDRQQHIKAARGGGGIRCAARAVVAAAGQAAPTAPRVGLSLNAPHTRTAPWLTGLRHAGSQAIY